LRARLLLRRVLALWGSDDGRGGLVYAGLLALTLRFDRLMDLAFGIRDWREILGLGLPWDQILPYWSAMWLFYFPGLLVLFSLACRSLIPLLWGAVVQLFGIHDLLYFLAQGIGMPGEFTYLEGTAAWSMATALGFGALTPFSLLVVSALGVVVGALLTTVYLRARSGGLSVFRGLARVLGR